ncbi:MAG: aromatic ring-hydroxylating dioxygenase subunit alpha [Cyanobacteriota bacterium]
MLVTQQPLLRKFWYPVCGKWDLQAGPIRFVLLGSPLVLWQDGAGRVFALEDRCCHRTARLSQGQVVQGAIQCPYHGWQFDGQGRCVQVPQIRGGIPDSYRVRAYAAQVAYGYVWVALESPLTGIPVISEAADPAFRLMHQLCEPWRCSGLRLMENSFDMAHLAFVHSSSFGDAEQPIPPHLDTQVLEYGLQVRALVPVVNPPEQQHNLQMADAKTLQRNDMIWYMPFGRKLTLAYHNGLIRIICTFATPIDDATSQVIQFCLSNDTEAEVPEADITAWERAIAAEDRDILESTDYDTPLDLEQEQHMASDKPGILMRRQLAQRLSQPYA